MSEQSAIEIKETSTQKNILLESAILIHGFKGNLQNINPQSNEVKTVKKVLTKGAIVSPSQRELDEWEKIRYQYDAPYDLKRVSFHVWKGEGKDECNYIGNIFFASPVTSLEGYVPTEDPAFSDITVSVYGKEGVNIPLDKGKLFMNLERFISMRDTIKQAADQKGMNYKDYVNKYLVILPRETFRDNDSLWNAIRARIEPSTEVTAHVVSAKEMDNLSLKPRFDFTAGLDSFKPASKEELGNGSIIEGGAVSRELTVTLKKLWKDRIRWLGKVERNLKADPFEIENIREKSEPEETLEVIEDLVPDNILLELRTLREKYNLDKQHVISENERILEEMFPDAPLESNNGKNRYRIRPPFSKPRVVKGDDGKIHVIKPV